jgi:hypothetical protein
MAEAKTQKLLEAATIYLTNVSSVETDDTCGMKYWMSHLEGGSGIMKEDEVLPHLLDKAAHNDLRALSTMEDISPPAIQAIIDDVLSSLSSEDKLDVGKMELLYRRLGWFAAFALYLEPTLRAEYETIPVDTEVVLDRDPLWAVAYPDRLLRNRSTGEVSYREYVAFPSGLTQQRWLQSWHYNIRLHLGLAALNEDASPAPNKPVFGQVVGLSRGFVSLLDKRLVHPFVWGYRNPITQEWASTNRSGGVWELQPVWSYPGGIVAWIQLCRAATAIGQFPISPAVYLNKDILNAWTARRVHREREIATVKKVALDNANFRVTYFNQATQRCLPAEDTPCPFLAKCWERGAKGTSLYVPALDSLHLT